LTKLEQMQAVPIDPTLQCWSATLAARFLLVRSVYGQGGNSEIYIFEGLTMTYGYQPLLRKLDEKACYDHIRPAIGTTSTVDAGQLLDVWD
jgi:hypothetical protein